MAIAVNSVCSSALRKSGATRCATRPASNASRSIHIHPGQFRANGTLRNQNAFDEAFGVKPGDAMYLPPELRISLWQTDREVACPEKAR
jgi:hypothetical protein